jgi:hypothetical protein
MAKFSYWEHVSLHLKLFFFGGGGIKFGEICKNLQFAETTYIH